MHPTLERQIKRSLGKGTTISPEWEGLLGSVSRTYRDFDEDRMLLDRSLEISSKEFLENNRRLEEARISVEGQAQHLALEVAKRTKELDERVLELEDVRKAMTNLLEDLGEEQKALTEAKAKDEALLESIGEGVVATDQDGKMIIMNTIAEKLLGSASEQIIGKPFMGEVVLEDTGGKQVMSALHPITLALSLRTTTITSDYYFIRKDGEKFPIAITTTPVLFGAHVGGAMVVFRDITKEKEIEKLRTDFLALASHQLRTPLSGTKWLIETIQRGILGALNPRQKKYIDNLYQINERMIRLVAEMLNILTLEGGVLVTNKEDVLVSLLYEELVLMTESAAQNKGVLLRSSFKDRKNLFVRSDLQTLRNILESLVSNAINYSSSGREVILGVTDEKDAVVFSVKDTGIGIPKEEQRRVFERFYRSSNAKEFKPDGTGLGLYSASLLAQKIGGKITFTSEENKGSTFYLRVPKMLNAEDDLNNIKNKSKL